MSTKAFKSEKIEEIKSKIEKAQVAVITDYKGLSVEEITKLRREIQKDGGDYMVTKNTLTKVAVKGTSYEVLIEKMTGPVALAFGFTDPVAPAKAVTNFIKEVKKGEILGAVLDGKLLSVEETKALAALPSKEELFAKMLGSINSPASGIVGSINAVMSQLTRAMAAVRDQKQAA
ncbi:50S ribosomal protein L10 [bacterium]|nr:50S ribosomal protein L10 [bacterium]